MCKEVTLLLNNDEIESLLDIPSCIGALESAYIELAAGRAVQRERQHTEYPLGDDTRYSLKSMDAILPNAKIAVLRLTTDLLRFPVIDGIERMQKVPVAGSGGYLGMVLVFGTDSGHLEAIFPDGYLQPIRVGATSGLGIKYLARKEAPVVGLLGTGRQAKAQLRAACTVRTVKLVKVYSPNLEHRTSFANQMSKALDIEIRPVATAREAFEATDIALSATNSRGPTFRPEWLSNGMHIGTIESMELDKTVLHNVDLAIVHSRRVGHRYLSNSRVEPMEEGAPPGGTWDGYAELAEVIGGVRSGRTDQNQTTLFCNNVGTGLQFASIAAVVLADARNRSLGRRVPSEWFLQNVAG